MANYRKELERALGFLREQRGLFYKAGAAADVDGMTDHLHRVLSLPLRNCDRYDGDRDGRSAAMVAFLREREKDAVNVTDGEAKRYFLAHSFEFLEWLMTDAKADVNTYHRVKVTMRGCVQHMRDLPYDKHGNKDGDAYTVDDEPNAVFVWIRDGFTQYDDWIEEVVWCDDDIPTPHIIDITKR